MLFNMEDHMTFIGVLVFYIAVELAYAREKAAGSRYPWGFAVVEVLSALIGAGLVLLGGGLMHRFWP
jgi:hypothetical protein